MKKQIVYRNISKEAKKSLSALFEERLSSLQPLLNGFEEDDLFLRAAVQSHGTQVLYRVALELYLPHKTLTAHEEGPNVETVIRDAFAEIRRQIKKHKSFLKNEPLWRRKKRRQQLRADLKAGEKAQEQERRKLYFDLIQSHLGALYKNAQREIAYLQAAGDLIENDITPDELVDAVVVRGYTRFEDRDSAIQIDRWLYQIMLEVLEEEVARSRAQMDLTLPTEASPPLAPSDTLDEEETEMFEYYLPDEQVRLEDLIPKPGVQTPEQAVVRWEQQTTVHQVLAMMPRLWRQSVVLTDIDGLSADETCEMLGIEPRKLEEIRHCAEAFLRQTLMEMGYTDIEEKAPSLSGLLGELAPVEMPEDLGSELQKKFVPETP